MTAAGRPRQLPRALGALDRLFNRLYGSRLNPLYQTGTIVVLLLLVLLVTGLWLLIFYRVGAPWDSVARLTADRWSGNWVRGVHRYASDAMVVATIVHALRMFLERRTSGPRVLAWVSGLVLLGVVWVAGWTGFVMVWDRFGLRLAAEGARLLDLLPFFSEPIGRTFAGDRPVPNAFFFLNLFLHVALPLGMGLGLWLHVSRLARPVLLPPRALGVGLTGLLVLIAIIRPLQMDAAADPFHIPASMPVDWFFAFWLPLSAVTTPAVAWLVLGAAGVALLLVPRLTRPPAASRPGPSVVATQLCTGCRQCALDCPFEAITMVERTDGRAPVVARVDPDRCVSCGLCAGSCAPMGIGPPGRNGRDQLGRLRALDAAGGIKDRVIVFGCDHGAGSLGSALEADGVTLVPVECVGNLHTSVLELAIRAGAAGTLVLSCPPRDCWSREGPKWLAERIDHGREAELKARVDRARVRVAEVAVFDRSAAAAAIAGFRRDLDHLASPARESGLEVDTACLPEEVP